MPRSNLVGTRFDVPLMGITIPSMGSCSASSRLNPKSTYLYDLMGIDGRYRSVLGFSVGRVGRKMSSQRGRIPRRNLSPCGNQSQCTCCMVYSSIGVITVPAVGGRRGPEERIICYFFVGFWGLIRPSYAHLPHHSASSCAAHHRKSVNSRRRSWIGLGPSFFPRVLKGRRPSPLLQGYNNKGRSVSVPNT